jgi:hypothetical protein
MIIGKDREVKHMMKLKGKKKEKGERKEKRR